jgi:hypothetical protein
LLRETAKHIHADFFVSSVHGNRLCETGGRAHHSSGSSHPSGLISFPRLYTPHSLRGWERGTLIRA